ncbi:MAG: SIMPL domain-containing protein [Flavobacteriales bacterium]
MKLNNFLMAASIAMAAISAQAQTTNIYEMPRVSVQGEATTKVEADMIYAYLNIYDNTYSYDYTTPYDDKAFKKKQQEIVEKMGVKNAMVSPTAASLMAGTAAGPFQLRFNSRAEFEAAQAKAGKENNESYSVSLEYNKAEISDEKRRTITAQMLELAMTDAKTKAEKMAKGFGAVLGRVLLIEEIKDYYAAPEYNYDYDGMYMQNMDMMVSITARVSVQYELK